MTKKKGEKKEKRDSALNALIFLNSLFSGECNKYEKKKQLKKKENNSSNHSHPLPGKTSYLSTRSI